MQGGIVGKKSKPELFVPEVEVTSDQPARKGKSAKLDVSLSEPEADKDDVVTGKVHCVTVKGQNNEPLQFTFSLKGKRGKAVTYGVDASNELQFNAKLALITAASISGAKLDVRVAAGNGNVPMATEVEMRARRT
jgi:hypothetical protein